MPYSQLALMSHFDVRSVATTAIVRTTHVGHFPSLLETQFSKDPSNRHYLLIHNTDKQTITIEMVRQIQETIVFALGSTERQEIILLFAELLSLPAQHALLKLLEEPPKRTRFWLVTDNPTILLPTIHSRAVSIVLPDEEGEEKATDTLPKALRAISLSDIRQASYSTLILHAARPKDRAESKAWCTHLLEQARSGEDRHDFYSQRALLTALESLEHNGNGKLVLESCFFHIKQGT